MKNEWKWDEINICHLKNNPTKKKSINKWKIHQHQAGEKSLIIVERRKVNERSTKTAKQKNLKLMNNSAKYVRYKFHWITDIRISFQSCRNKLDFQKLRGWKQWVKVMKRRIVGKLWGNIFLQLRSFSNLLSASTRC